MATGTTFLQVPLYIPLQLEEPPRPTDSQLLFKFRTAYTGQGRPIFSSYTFAPEEEPPPRPIDQQLLFRFRSSAPSAPKPQPFWLNQPARVTLEPEQLPRPSDSQALFAFRGPAPPAPPATPQPFWIFPRFIGSAEPEPFPVQLDQQRLFGLRLGIVIVPNVVGETQAQATTDITAVGLVASPSSAYSGSVPAGSVISQSPVAGSAVGRGSMVSILVSLGPPPSTGITYRRQFHRYH